MSRVGKMPVSVPAGVELQFNADSITAKGKMGEMTMAFDPQFVSFAQEGVEVQVTRKSETKECRSRHGLYRSLLENLTIGVSEGFKKTLEIKGVGYRAALKGQGVELNLGYSHPIQYDLPEGIKVEFEEKSQTVFTVSGMDKQKVGQVSAEIRSFRKPEPYKGKGIRYQGEYILRKAGKSSAK